MDSSIYAQYFTDPSSYLGKLVYQEPEFGSLLCQLSNLAPEEKTMKHGSWRRLLPAIWKGRSESRNLLKFNKYNDDRRY